MMDGTTMGREPDGRNRRLIRSKAAIMEATRRAMQSGIFQPAAPEVAKAAGVSVRTVFQHYGNIDALRRAALEDNATFQAILDIAMGSTKWREAVTLPIGAGDRIVVGIVLGRLPT